MNLDIMSKIAEGKIQEAIEEGKFDNLPGKGKPIVFDDDPMTPVHLRLANKILKNAGALPEWIQIRKDILDEREEIQRFKARAIREGHARRARLTGQAANPAAERQFAEWHVRTRAEYLRRLKSVNTSILKFSMTAPATSTAFSSYRLENEMAEFDRDFPPLNPDLTITMAEDQPDSGSLKKIARARYEAAKARGHKDAE